MELTDKQRAAVDTIGQSGLTPDQTVEFIKEVGTALPPEKRQQAAAALFGLPPTRVNGLYWLVLGTLCAVLLLCALRLVGVSWFAAGGTNDQIVGIFTTIISFLIGLFVPSPVAAR